MTPAEELRAAAKALRCDHTFPVCPPEGSVFKPGNCRHCGVQWGQHKKVAEELAEPIATWLESAVWHTEQITPDENALAVARALLGVAR